MRASLNLPNTLTTLRLALVPLFLWFLMWERGEDTLARWAAVTTFSLAMITDLIDGKVARRWGQVTNFGKIADPIADKVLVGGALIGLSLLGVVPWWMTIVILARELIITVIRLVLVRRVVLPAGRGGKLKTTVQTIALIALISPLTLWGWAAGRDIGMVFLWLAVIVTVVSGLDYLRSMRQAVLDAAAT